MRILTVFFTLLVPLKVSFSSPQLPPAVGTPLGDLFDERLLFGIDCFQVANKEYHDCLLFYSEIPLPDPTASREREERFNNHCFNYWIDHLQWCAGGGGPYVRPPPRERPDEEHPQEEAPEAPQAPPRKPVNNKVIRFLRPQA